VQLRNIIVAVSEHITESDVDDWVFDLKMAGKSPRTLGAYGSTAKAVLAYCGGTLDRHTLRGWLAHEVDACAPATAQTRLAIMKQFTKWAVAEKLLDHDPAATLAGPQVRPPRIEPLTRDEVAALIAGAESARDKAVISLMCATGMRLAEVTALQVSDIVLETRQVDIQKGKGGKKRRIKFNTPTRRLLSRWLRERRDHKDAATGALWLGVRGPLTRHGINLLLKQAAEAAGIKDVHPHRLRHSWAHHQLAIGVSEGSVCYMAGWSSRAMLDRYTSALASERALDEYDRYND
jgi:site-specific recombinase XerD